MFLNTARVFPMIILILMELLSEVLHCSAMVWIISFHAVTIIRGTCGPRIYRRKDRHRARFRVLLKVTQLLSAQTVA